MARIKKSVKTKGYPHREHRAKKGRKYKPEISFVKKYKAKKETLKIKELEEEIKQIK